MAAVFNNFSLIQAAVSISTIERCLLKEIGTSFRVMLPCTNLPAHASHLPGSELPLGLDM